MPPKAKFTRDEIIEAAFEIVREQGLDELTARALGAKLGSSARPIFTVFQSMEEVQHDVIAMIRRDYDRLVDAGLNRSDMPAFKGAGTSYIEFAITEPNFFRVLFMSEKAQKPEIKNVLPFIDDNYARILESVENLYGMSREDAEWLYRHLWIYTHGIATLCVTEMCTFSASEISTMLTDVCMAMIKEIKGRQKQ